MHSVYNLELTQKVTHHFENVLNDYSYVLGNNTIKTAQTALAELKKHRIEPYVLETISELESMIVMVSDNRWTLSKEDRRSVLAALDYFSKKDDVIPDDTPVIGLLDDCIVIEIVANKIKSVLASYDDFKVSEKIYATGANYSLDDWEKNKTRERLNRMRSRRNKTSRSRRTRSSSFSVC